MAYVVTGSSRGIGLELVRQLAERGDTVVATCRNPSKATELQKIQEAFPRLVHTIPLDTISQESIDAAVESVQKILPKGITVLINNAAINDPPRSSASKASMQELTEKFHTNVSGTVAVTNAFLPLLRKARENGSPASIIMVSSDSGSLKMRLDSGASDSIAYFCSKAGLNMASISFANELKKEDIKVLILHPGWVQTDMGSMAATLTPQESITAVLKVIDSVPNGETARYVNWKGESMPW
ncbi:hypothetical protein BZG36_01223 [Bifiguratus adelaidae]|uniref:Uncharacterized protein n=1 Tax=Bifiguratus adelaidae TaxID=1938954 RepID=A0A261Y5Q8_9FUNG|nr:hypothetical protein BZG36_01223 [Bifiguratus adelaidae]